MTKSVVISQKANHGHLCIPLIHFYFIIMLYWAKMGFDKKLGKVLKDSACL